MATLQKTVKAARQINAVVISSGKMQNTVKVRVGVQKWDNHIRKQFSRREHLLVHDPRSSLVTGDVISISPGWRVSKHVRHVVSSIIAPFGTPIQDRPAVPTEEERIRERERKGREKRARRRERRRGEGESASGEERGRLRIRESEVQVETLGESEVVQEKGQRLQEAGLEEKAAEALVEDVEAPKKKRGWFS